MEKHSKGGYKWVGVSFFTFVLHGKSNIFSLVLWNHSLAVCTSALTLIAASLAIYLQKRFGEKLNKLGW